MKIGVIRRLAELHDLQDLESAEKAIVDGEAPPIEIPGDDEGEQLTHAMAAAWIKRAVVQNGMEPAAALRAFVDKVRNSIS
jgi:hypothetical protein